MSTRARCGAWEWRRGWPASRLAYGSGPWGRGPTLNPAAPAARVQARVLAAAAPNKTQCSKIRSRAGLPARLCIADADAASPTEPRSRRPSRPTQEDEGAGSTSEPEMDLDMATDWELRIESLRLQQRTLAEALTANKLLEQLLRGGGGGSLPGKARTRPSCQKG